MMTFLLGIIQETTTEKDEENLENTFLTNSLIQKLM